MTITQAPSPNHASRLGHAVTIVVLHATAGSYASALAWLTSRDSRVSAHYLIDKSGHITQLIDERRAAWHAGRASWRGESFINEASIGIELVNVNTGRDPYPAPQIASATDLTRQIVHRYQIERANVIRHADCAIPPGRKSDPAGLDWPAFLDRVFGVGGGIGAMRARAYSYIRPEPSTARRHVATLRRGDVVQVARIITGERVQNTWGVSDLWAETTTPAGWIWAPQLEAA